MKKSEETTVDTQKIHVQLLSINGDVKDVDDVNYIKIKSKQYNLIIMKDYLPIIGEIDGRVEIGMEKDNIVLEKVTGYYMHKHNKFNLFYVEE